MTVSNQVNDKNNSNLSLLKAMDILECLYRAEKALTPSQIAQKTGIQRPTVYRLLNTLAQRAWVCRDEQIEGGYRLGYRILTMAGKLLKHTDLRSVAHTHMDKFVQQYDESISLFLLDGNEVVHLDRIDSSRPFQTYIPVGGRGCLHSKSVGKAILACLKPEEVEKIISACGLNPVTPHTLTDRTRLEQELNLTRQRGYGISNEEDVEGLRAVGAAILNMEGRPLGGIAISGLVSYMSWERMDLLGNLLKTTAGQISIMMGYPQ